MTEHAHYWIVDPPEGTWSDARCACGATARFRNSEAERSFSAREWHDRRMVGAKQRSAWFESTEERELRNAKRNKRVGDASGSLGDA